MPGPITVTIARRVAPERDAEMFAWTQAGMALANDFPGFLGAGWVRPAAGAQTWHLLYRFADADTLERWDTSRQRSWWLAAGSSFVEETHVERRTGIEGWFDAPASVEALSRPPSGPPRWKQAVAIFSVFFPLSVVANALTSSLAGGWLLPARVLLACLLMTPVMVYVALPWVTRRLDWFLQGRPAPWRRAVRA